MVPKWPPARLSQVTSNCSSCPEAPVRGGLGSYRFLCYGSSYESPRFPLKGSLKGGIDIGIDFHIRYRYGYGYRYGHIDLKGYLAKPNSSLERALGLL